MCSDMLLIIPVGLEMVAVMGILFWIYFWGRMNCSVSIVGSVSWSWYLMVILCVVCRPLKARM